MTAFEICILGLSLSGSLAFISIVAAILSELPVKATGFLVILTAGFYLMASQSREEPIAVADLNHAIAKSIALLLG